MVKHLERYTAAIVALGREFPAGHLVERHHHDRSQLIYASSGVMRVHTSAGIWVVPPLRAVWVPSAIDHEIRASTSVSLRTLYIRSGLRRSLPKKCCVIEVSPLLRELILRLVSLGEHAPNQRSRQKLVDLALDEICQFETLPLRILMPTDPRLVKICQALLDNPANIKTSREWGQQVGASPRTLERTFQKEIGTSFGTWRRQVRVLDALSRIADGVPIMNIAFDLGYENPSAFAAMFKRTVGVPPSEYFVRSGKTID